MNNWTFLAVIYTIYALIAMNLAASIYLSGQDDFDPSNPVDYLFIFGSILILILLAIRFWKKAFKEKKIF